MNKKFTVVIVAVAILVVTWVTMGSEGKEVPYVTITELKDSNHAKPGIRYRLGGIVKKGTIQKQEEDPLALAFVLQQEEEILPVSYHKIVPDLFKEGAEVIVEGYYVKGNFQADNLMTKCASRYEGDLRDTPGYEGTRETSL